MGTVTNIESARRRRVVSRFCTECRTPWSLTAVRRDEGFVIICRQCGSLRAAIPSQQRG